MSNSVFNLGLIEKRMKELESLPPFEPHRDEPRFTVTQFFEDTMTECTLWFVVRDGEMIFYDSITIKV